ncbi:1625_t:CDS:2 [Funneliformis caledonium]|uniref:1625_t:CDS:1 n=1 Tax=Funneliformis caledonium TaxID=1117310 RepID=A0A9N9HIJ5_9GLOM|nr:1625_t:CDS:2 [Funneliformis caledonium]
MSIVRSKLISDMNYNNWLDLKKKGGCISDMKCLAILGSRLCLDIFPQRCISEAILAKASVHITDESEGVELIRVLDPLINMIKEGLVEEGY